MFCLRCQHPLAQMDPQQREVLFGICIRCGLIRIAFEGQPPWIQSLEKPRPATARSVRLEPRHKQVS